MIPSNQLANVIQIERDRDLERWQRLRAAKAATQPRAGTGRIARLMLALDLRRQLGRPKITVAVRQEHTAAASAGCC